MNLKFREGLIRLGTSSKEAGEGIWLLCARDILFYVNCFGFLQEPREAHCPAIPFITWPIQDRLLLKIQDAILAPHNLLIEKGRDMGATWSVLTVYGHRLVFFKQQSYLVGSRKEDLVDKTDDPDALLPKLDYQWGYLPPFLKPSIDSKHMHRMNEENGSVIDGESTTKDFARQRRRASVFLDEAPTVDSLLDISGAVNRVTGCMIYCGTPKPLSTAGGSIFYKMTRQKGLEKIGLYWPEHPKKAAGMYRWTGDQLEIFDKGYDFPSDFEFPKRPDGKEGKTWSPEMALAWDRYVDSRMFYQEEEGDYHAIDKTVFPEQIIDEHKKQYATPAWHQGTLRFDAETLQITEFLDDGVGPLQLWIDLDVGRVPPWGRYAIGGDLSAGSESSNSCLSVVDRYTGRKVAQFVSNTMLIDELSDYAVALARWFHNAEIIWEANGPLGTTFRDIVATRPHRNAYEYVYYHQDDKSVRQKISDKPGWYSTPDSKEALVRGYMHALKSGKFMNPSEPALDECLQFIYLSSGGIGHSSAASTQDPAGKKKYHGDMVIADSLANHLCFPSNLSFIQPEPKVERGSMMDRHLKAQAAARRVQRY